MQKQMHFWLSGLFYIYLAVNIWAQTPQFSCAKRDSFTRVKGLERVMVGAFMIDGDSMLVASNHGIWRVHRKSYIAKPIKEEKNTSLKKQLQLLNTPSVVCYNDGDAVYVGLEDARLTAIQNDKVAELVTLFDGKAHSHYLVGQQIGIAKLNLGSDSVKSLTPEVEYSKIFKKYIKKGIEVWAAAPADGCSLWLGTTQGLFLYDMEQHKLVKTEVTSPIYTLYPLPSSGDTLSILVGGNQVFGKLTIVNKRSDSTKLSKFFWDKDVFAIDVDEKDGTYWVAAQSDDRTLSGTTFNRSVVCNYSPSQKQLIHTFSDTSKPVFPSRGVRVASILVDTLNNTIWVGTLGSGIYILPKPNADTCRLQMLDSSFVVCMGDSLDTMKFITNQPIKGLKFEKNSANILDTAMVIALAKKLKVLVQCSKDTFDIKIIGHACSWKEYAQRETINDLSDTTANCILVVQSDTLRHKLTKVDNRDSTSRYILIQKGTNLAKDRGNAVSQFLKEKLNSEYASRLIFSTEGNDCFSAPSPPLNSKQAGEYLRTDIIISRKPSQK